MRRVPVGLTRDSINRSMFKAMDYSSCGRPEWQREDYIGFGDVSKPLDFSIAVRLFAAPSSISEWVLNVCVFVCWFDGCMFV